MRSRVAVVMFVFAAHWLCLAPTVEAQLTETIQKLLPATVAVELKAESAAGPSDEQSQNSRRRQQLAYTQAGELLLDSSQPLPVAEQAGGGAEIDAVSYSSGTVLAPDGLIVTMLGSAEGDLTVTFHDGVQAPAQLLVADRRSGLQLLKVESRDLTSVEITTSDVLLGQQVATVVCTDVNDRAAATGIVTARDRFVGDLAVELLQTDVQIGPMSAGAPLANLRGELIGIFVARENDAAGLSFAIPAKYVRELINAQKGSEAVVLERGFLGVQLNDDEEAVDAPYVTRVMEDSPAQDAGFKKGDTITKIDGESIATPKQVVRMIGRRQAGEQVRITAVREGLVRELEVRLGGYPEPAASAAASNAWQQSIQLLQPSHVVVAGEDGNLRVLQPDGFSAVLSYDLFAAEQQSHQPGKPKLNDEQMKALIESYNQALKAQSQIGTILGQPAIRVERSDVQKQLAELTERVRSLQAEVEQLTEELKKVGQKLADD